jgi:hypothetical protein
MPFFPLLYRHQEYDNQTVTTSLPKKIMPSTVPLPHYSRKSSVLKKTSSGLKPRQRRLVRTTQHRPTQRCRLNPGLNPLPCFPFFFVTHPLLISFLHQTRPSERDNGYVSFDYDLDLGCFRNLLEYGYEILPMNWEADFGLKQCLIFWLCRSGVFGSFSWVFCVVSILYLGLPKI